MSWVRSSASWSLADQAGHHAKNDVAVTLDELLERVQVAAERGAHKGLIGIGGHSAL